MYRPIPLRLPILARSPLRSKLPPQNPLLPKLRRPEVLADPHLRPQERRSHLSLLRILVRNPPPNYRADLAHGHGRLQLS
ncbi:hypothetical protein LINPERHAP1_LOCUS2470 [Linum perenne]